MSDDVPLICDPPPGSRWILTTPLAISPQQAEQLREAWDRGMRGPHFREQIIILQMGMTIEELPGRYEWPDAEFCAA